MRFSVAATEKGSYIDKFVLDDFLSSVADGVHGLHPQHLIFRFHLLGHALGFCHLLHNQREAVICLFVQIRKDGVKPILSNLRKGGLLYLLADMDFGRNDSLFVPFFGVPAATVPSLSRFARLGRAKVIGMATRLVPGGYVAEITPAWEHYPTDDLAADTAEMNRRLEQWIAPEPGQYYWVHKRFKSRPAGEASVY